MRLVIETNSAEQHGWTLLHIASQNGHLDVVQQLIDAGIAISIWNVTYSSKCLVMGEIPTCRRVESSSNKSSRQSGKTQPRLAELRSMKPRDTESLTPGRIMVDVSLCDGNE